MDEDFGNRLSEKYKGNRKSYWREVKNQRNAENISLNKINEVMDENGKILKDREAVKERSIYLSISPTPRPLMEHPPQRGGHGIVVYLSPCSGTPSQRIPNLSHALPLSLQYSSTLLIHFTGGLPLTPHPSIVPLYTLFVKSHSFILITCPYHLSVLHFTHSATPQSIPTVVSFIPNLPYISSLLSLSNLGTP